MFSFLQGSVKKIARREVVLLTSCGVGYQVFVNEKVLTNLEVGQQLGLWIFTHQTAESLTLFGFLEEGDLAFFKLLLTVNKVGPKIALEILETPRETLEGFLETGDAEAFARVRGVGAKTARRIVLELKGRLVGEGGAKIPEEVLSALAGLGFKQADIKKRLTDIPKDIIDPEEIVKWFLQNP